MAGGVMCCWLFWVLLALGGPGSDWRSPFSRRFLLVEAVQSIISNSDPTADQSINSNKTDACGGYIDEGEGVLQSPSFPDLYPPNKNCVWQIVARDQHKITLTFTHFDLERNAPDCTKADWVRVSSGQGANPKVHGVFCGQTSPTPITSEGNILRVHFHSDHSISRTGFQARFTTDKDECLENNGGCQDICTDTVGSYQCGCRKGFVLHANSHDCVDGGCQHSYNNSEGEITSPSWPDPYPASQNCSWRLTTAPGHRVRVTFGLFELESHQRCAKDHVSLYDGEDSSSTSLGTFCGLSVPGPFTSSGNVMLVIFESDGEGQRWGFEANYRSVCGGQLSATEKPQTIYSHAKYGMENYGINVDCVWQIQTQDGSGRVQLRFTAFDIEPDTGSGCLYDAVIVVDGQDRSVFCGNKLPPTITSKGTSLTLRFQTDDSVTFRGFVASFVGVANNVP